MSEANRNGPLAEMEAQDAPPVEGRAQSPAFQADAQEPEGAHGHGAHEGAGRHLAQAVGEAGRAGAGSRLGLASPLTDGSEGEE